MSKNEENKPQDKLGSIEFSFKYPFSNSESKYGGVLFGFVMVLISFLIIPLFTLNGYFFKLKEYAAKGEPEAPKFESWSKLTKEGFFAWVALLVLFIPILVVTLLFEVLESARLLDTTLGLLFSIVFVLVYLLVIAASPIVGVVYSVKRDIVATYTDPELYSLLFSVTYLISIFKYLLVAIVALLIYFVGSLVTLGLGIIILLPLLMYIRPCFWGHIYYRWNEKNNS